MNLQPYAPITPGPSTIRCKSCNRQMPVTEIYADLDGKQFEDYYCAKCCTFYDVDDIMTRNRNTGHHFFSRENMKHFSARVNPDIYHGIYFITSEQFVAYHPSYHKEPRKYTVRRANPDGSISDMSDFQAFDTLAQARAFAKTLPPLPALATGQPATAYRAS